MVGGQSSCTLCIIEQSVASALNLMGASEASEQRTTTYTWWSRRLNGGFPSQDAVVH